MAWKKDNEQPVKKIKDPLLKALKMVTSLSERSMDEASLKRHRASMERTAKLAVPRGNVEIHPFSIGEMACEEICPAGAENDNHAVLYIHGGGYITGGISYARVLGVKLALATGYRTYSFAYRLAPEKPYPAALEDSEALWKYLLDKGFLPQDILIAGDSAGGNMALCMAQKMKAEGMKLPGRLLLFSPWTDMTATAPSYETYEKSDPILTKAYVEGAAKAYIADAGEADDPRFSPLFGDLSGLPPVFIMAGRNEILLDDSVRLADRIEECGGQAALDIEEVGWHVYAQMPIPIAARAMKRLGEYLAADADQRR